MVSTWKLVHWKVCTLRSLREMKNWDNFRKCVSCLGQHNRSDHLSSSTRIEKEQEMRSSVSDTFPYHDHIPYVTSWRCWGGGLMQSSAQPCSVVDLPDLSTVNIQGWVKVSSGQQRVRHSYTWAHTNTRAHTHAHTHRGCMNHMQRYQCCRKNISDMSTCECRMLLIGFHHVPVGFIDHVSPKSSKQT